MPTENLKKELVRKKHRHSWANNSKTDGQDAQQKFDTRFQTPQALNVNITALEKELRQTVSGEVRFDAGTKALYSTDASNYRQIPIGVVLPKSEEDIINTLAACRKYGAPVLSRGGGTSLAGQSCNVAVMMDMSKYHNKVLSLDTKRKLVTVQPGIVLDEMRKVTENNAGLTFGPDPATHSRCTIGGMLGNNSCGVHSVMSQFLGHGARTSDNTESLVIITYDGVKMKVGATSDEQYNEIIKEGGRKAGIYKKLKDFRDKYGDLIREKFPQIPRRVSGYNLPELLPENGFNIARALVGSESTCVTILEATMKLVPNPKARTLLVLGYHSLPDAGYAVPDVLNHKPIGLEAIDDLLIEFNRRKGMNMKDISLLPFARAWLMVEFGGDSKEDADSKAKKLMDELKQKKDPPAMTLFDDPEQEHMLWVVRESSLGATAWVPGEPNGGPGWEDSAVQPEKVGDYVKELRALFNKYDYHPSIYGHFGQGCVHCRVGFDFETAEGIQKYKQFTVEASHLVVKYGGSLSGEHGDGQSRGDLLEIMYGKEMVQAFKEFKAIWDPDGKMNPGKIVNTYGQLSNLRLGTTYDPPEVKTHFQFPDEDYDFNRATLKCVGVGECRRHEGGTMCPSYMVTHEEKHSTRGRARMLFEMMQGDVTRNRWQDKDVKQSLDLCLACKGCKSDCPVNVDMATYKSEFLSHYYKGKLRPRTAYAFGWVYWWSRLASLIPNVANFFMHAPLLKNITKAIAGVHQQRTMPKYADVTFREWFRARTNQSGVKSHLDEHEKSGIPHPKSTVILWTDTFNNFFLPETLVAATEVLEAAGFEVAITRQSLCCGRPLYDFGMLNTAKKMLINIMHQMRKEIAQGIPVIVLEPSCASVFRDELHNLFPHDENATRLSKGVFTLAEFLEKHAPGFTVPELKRKAIVHGHCHHKAIMKMDYDKTVLKKMQLDHQILDSGCCGMAGYFGYEHGDHYDVSIKAGERVLLPAVRQASDETIIIADGFSCREQIAQETGRKALHLAQVLQMALHGKDSTNEETLPEKKYIDGMKLKDPNKTKRAIMIAAAFVAGFVAVSLMNNRKS